MVRSCAFERNLFRPPDLPPSTGADTPKAHVHGSGQGSRPGSNTV